MFSQKFQILIISSLLVSVLVGVSSALGANESTLSATRTPPKAYLNPIIENNLVRQSCLPINGNDTLDCSVYFDAKKHLLLDDPSNCLVFGYHSSLLPSQRNDSCKLRFPANACMQKDQSWLSACFKVYYADTFSLNRRNNSTIAPKALVDNLKIGSFQASSAKFTDVAVFLVETDGFTEPVELIEV